MLKSVRNLTVATVAFAGALAFMGPVGAATKSHAAAAKPQNALTTINLSYVPYSNDSSLFLGMKRGYFRQHGITVNLSTAAAPTFTIADIESGQAQLAFTTTVVLVNSAAHGTGLECVSSVDGNQTTNVKDDGTLLLATPQSGIKTVADLVGKTVGTVQLASLNTLTTQAMVQKAGGDPRKVQFVSMGFALMPQALQQGTVQAAIVTEPFADEAVAEGMVVVAHPNISIMAGQSTTCFAGTQTWVNSHKRLAKNFLEAMDEAIAYTKSHPAAAAATLQSYGLATSLANAESQKLGTDFNPIIKPISLAKVATLLEQFGYITTPANSRSLIFPGA
jgi:NitT/TauT family transport system substrate-binding protein